MEQNIPDAEAFAFVTVGTTQFDELIKQFDDDNVIKALKARGITHLVLQIGRGSRIPKYFRDGQDEAVVSGIKCSYFRFKPNIKDDILKSALVISHAGSGTIIEFIRSENSNKKTSQLVVVVNEQLMDNHQIELAEALQRRKVLQFTNPGGLCKLLKQPFTAGEPYPEPDYFAFPSMVEKEMFPSH